MLIFRHVSNEEKQTIIKKNQVHDKDTGSPEVQVAVISAAIDELAKHLKKHKKIIIPVGALSRWWLIDALI